MRKRLALVSALAVSLSMIGAADPAAADPDDLLIANDSGICGISVSIGIVTLGPGVSGVSFSGSGNCPGAPDVLDLCLLAQLPNGDYSEAGLCATSTASNGGSASMEAGCTPGMSYKARLVAASPGYVRKRKTAPVTCL